MRRTPASSERADSKETRDKLLKAGLRIFARDGYHVAGIRAISAEAGVNSAMVGYHFGGKEGLYSIIVSDACEIIRSRTQRKLELALETLRTGSAQDAHRAACELLDPVIDLVLDPESTDWSKIMLHEQMNPGPGFGRFHQAIIHPTLEALAALLAKASGRAPGSRDMIEAMVVLGMPLIFRSASSSSALLLPDDIAPSDFRRIIGDAINRAIYRDSRAS